MRISTSYPSASTRPRDWKTKSGLRSTSSRPSASPPKPPPAAARALDHRAVHLHAERIHGEDERLPAVAEGAEEELHVVVGVDAIAVGEGRLHAVGAGLRAHAEMQRRRRVPDEHVGLAAGRTAVDRRVSREAGQARGLLPHGLVEHAVDHDLGVDAGRLHLELPVDAGKNRRRQRRGRLTRGRRPLSRGHPRQQAHEDGYAPARHGLTVSDATRLRRRRRRAAGTTQGTRHRDTTASRTSPSPRRSARFVGGFHPRKARNNARTR